MSGKKSGLNASLRKLLARIQREFDYPRVYAARYRPTARVRAWRDRPEATVRAPPPITAATRDLPLAASIVAVRAGALGSATCRRELPLTAVAATVRAIPCLEPANLAIHRAELAAPAVACRSAPLDLDRLAVRAPRLPASQAVVRGESDRLKARVLGDAAQAALFPLRLQLFPMDVLPVKLQLRYRAATLKALRAAPKRVTFVGVCPGLPPVPLKVVDFELEGMAPRALARIAGNVNPHYGRRAWVIIRMDGKAQYLPITVKEE